MRNFLLSIFALVISVSGNAQEHLKFKYGFNKAADIQYTPDQTLLCIADDNELVFYTSGTGNKVKTVKPAKSKIVAFSFHDDGVHAVIAFANDEVVLFDLISNSILKKFKVDASILSARLAEDFKVAIATEKSVMVYDFTAEKLIATWSEHSKPIRSLTVSKDGKNIASGGGDGFVIVYDLIGAVLSKKEIHTTWVRSLTFSPDGKTIASGDDKGNVFLSDLTGNVLYTFTDASGWVRSLQFSGDGKYLATGDEKGNCLVYWVERKTISQRFNNHQPIIQIRFKPDGKELATLVDLKGMRTWDVTALSIAPVFKFRDQKDNTPPQIFVSNPPNTQNDERIRFSEDLLDLRGIVVDESGIRSLKINGIVTPIKDNGNFVMNMPLSMGDNFVTIEAKDVNDNIAIKKFIIDRKNLSGEEYDHSKAKNHLIVVGINEYEHWPKLYNAVKDASDVASTLLTSYTFDFANVVMLKNEQATRNNIYKSLRSLIEQITPQDNLIIYYSGHGYFDELLNEGYWIPVDARTNESGDYLSNSDLLKIIGSIDSQHTFLVADACFSGSLFSDSKRGYAENVEKFRSRWGLASGRLEVVSDGTEGENSPFTETFLEFLKTNEEEKFPVSELIQYVKIKVAEKSDQTPLGNPLKSAGDEGGEFVFYKKN